ncbi:MAG: T9SS type A sorting domain-containing protein, partial [Taibaiella sp.]|nr:T9SS type A sorting domain-containing protein [Taibaiella sp.]
TGASFQWRGPNSYGSLVQNPVLENVTTAASGTYSLVTTLNGCSSSAITIVVVNAGEAETEELILFPNPNKGNFTIRAKVTKDQMMPYEVVNVLGMVVYADMVTTVNQRMERVIDIDGSLPSGVYIFRIMMSGQSREIPFTITR